LISYEADRISYEDALRNADSMNELRLRIKLEGKAMKAKDKLEDLGHLSLEDKEEDRGLQGFVPYYNKP
jgi:twitching motility protein PilU